MQILFFSLTYFTYAKHIIGGEIIYDDKGGGNYAITVKIYRDPSGGGAQFDGLGTGPGAIPAILTVYKTNGDSLYGAYNMGVPVVSIVPPSINNPCIYTPQRQVELGVYSFNLNLPKVIGGYYLVYQRCCRNSGIINIVNPGDQGASYFAYIPGKEKALTNSSPRFKNLPPIFLCNGVFFSFDHSAYDPDGDSLSYSMCNAYDGLDQCCSALQMAVPVGCTSPPPACPNAAPPQPYTPIIYGPGYSASYPINSANPAISINPTTGLFTLKPNLTGLFLFTICVSEYRNGLLIGTYFRDFQIEVYSCVVSVAAAISSFTQQCVGQNVQFNNLSVNTASNQTNFWDFGVTSLTNDTSILKNPFYAYPDTGTYTVTLIVNKGQICTDTTKITVYAYPPMDINYSLPPAQCLVTNNFSFSVHGVYAQQASFSWNFGPSANPVTSTLSSPSNIVFNSGGYFPVWLHGKQFACRDSFLDSIYVYPRPKAIINNLPNSLCNPAKVSFSNGSTSTLPLTYFWQFSNGATSTQFQPTLIFTPAGVYGVTLTVKTNSICIDSNQISIKNLTVYPNPKAGFTYTPQVTSIFDNEVSVYNTASSDVVGWSYNFGDNYTTNYPDFIHAYQNYGTYTITQIVNNQYMCTDTLKQLMIVYPEFRLWVPNCFTPGKDNLNDVFLPIVIGVINYELDIYDRWGEKIFSTTSTNDGWNGMYKGSLCKEDIYVWRIAYTNVTDMQYQVKTGHVTLLKK